MKYFQTRNFSYIKESYNDALKDIDQTTKEYLDDTSQFKNAQHNLRQRGLATMYNVQDSVMEKFTVLMARLNIYYNKHYYDFEVTDLENVIFELKSEIALYQEKCREFIITSPVSGEVVKLTRYQNEYVARGKEIMIIANESRPYVLAYMPLKLVNSDFLTKRAAEISFDNSGYFAENNTFNGKIVSMSTMTETEKKIFVQKEEDAVLVIRITDKLPERFCTYGYPVKVRLKK